MAAFDALAPVHSLHRAPSGIRPRSDTYPLEGLGGVRGTGEGGG